MNVEALKELAAKVEADKVPPSDLVRRALGKWAGDWKTTDLVDWIFSPHDLRQMGAAKALHEAVLPGWAWSVKTLATDSVQVWTDRAYGLRQPGYIGTTKDNPARAWLLAILRALISQAQKGGE